MGFLRNPEIKIHLAIYAVISLALIIGAFFIGIQTGIFVFIVCLFFNAIFIITTYKRYLKIAELSRDIDLILHGNTSISFDIYNEGELAVLKNEISKMIIRLKEQSDSLIKDKIFLMDSIADISHQLRTPLTSINIITDFLGKSDVSDERRKELIKQLEKLTDRTNTLISSLLKMSKIDTGTINFKKKKSM